MTLNINPDTVRHLADLARTFHAREAVTIPEDLQQPSGDWGNQMLAEHPGDPTLDEFRAVLTDLEPDQLAELVALFRVGREDYAPAEWHLAVQSAGTETPQPLDDYLIGHPLLAAYLEAGLDAVADLEAE
ncbi:MAG: DUF3775 domain-containing protein [Gammaproteobacteria bacterium]